MTGSGGNLADNIINTKDILFRVHPIFTSYVISNKGHVLSLLSGKFLEPQKNIQTNYLQFGIRKDGDTVLKAGHRLVTEAFLGLSELEVNHKDKNRQNNSLDNLEYVTSSENTIHSRMGKKRFVFSNSEGHFYIKIVRKGYGLIAGGKIFTDKEDAYDKAKELYNQHFGVYPW